MAGDEPANPLLSARVVIELDGMASVRRETGRFIAADGETSLEFATYLPPQAGNSSESAPESSGWPVVVLVTGYPDARGLEMFGCRLMDLPAYDGWPRLIACHGVAAVVYENRDPERDVDALFDHLRAHQSASGLDMSRAGIWSASGNAPNALAFLARTPGLRAAAFCYGYTLDLAGHADVAAAASQFGFLNPAAGLDVARLPAAVPVWLLRAGRDELPGLNAAMTRFADAAASLGRDVRVCDYAEGRHAFDVVDDSDGSRAAISATLEFLRDELTG